MEPDAWAVRRKCSSFSAVARGSKANREAHCSGWLKTKGLLNGFCLSGWCYLPCVISQARLPVSGHIFLQDFSRLTAIAEICAVPAHTVSTTGEKVGTSARTNSPRFIMAIRTFSLVTGKCTRPYNWHSSRPLLLPASLHTTSSRQSTCAALQGQCWFKRAHLKCLHLSHKDAYKHLTQQQWVIRMGSCFYSHSKNKTGVLCPQLQHCWYTGHI